MKDTNIGKRRYMRTHAKSLVDMLKKHCPDPLVGAEVGVFKGETTAALLASFPNLKMYMVDTWTAWRPGDVYYDKHVSMGRLPQSEWDKIKETALQNASNFPPYRYRVLQGLSEEFAVRIQDNSLDFVFLDANHMFEDVRKDILMWRPKVRPGGLIAGHDYLGVLDSRGIWGVSRAVDLVLGQENVIVGKGYVWGVIKEEKK